MQESSHRHAPSVLLEEPHLGTHRTECWMGPRRGGKGANNGILLFTQTVATSLTDLFPNYILSQKQL
jgi:hypothetical protein